MKNLLFMTLSNFREEIKEFSYKGEKYYTYSQMEPIIDLFLDKYPNENLTVLAICSEMAQETFEYLKNNEKYNNGLVNFEKIDISDINSSEEMELVANKTVDFIREWKEEGKEHCFWIDNHGGPRDYAMLLISIISLLKVDGIVPDKVYNVRTIGDDGLILDTTKGFKIFDFVSGMNAFIQYGDASILDAYYKDSENEKVKNILSSMQTISNATKLCDSELYKQGCNQLTKAIKGFEPGDDNLLNIFVEYIKSDYEGMLEDKNKRNALGFVKRSLKKGMYQQALTFVESLMPQYIIKEIFSDLKWDKEKLSEAKTIIGMKWAIDENILFDKWIENSVFSFYPGDSDFEIKSKKMIEAFSKGTIDDKKIADIVKKDELYKVEIKKYQRGKEPEILFSREVVFKDNIKPNLIVRFALLHYSLKKCRNLINHSVSKNRPNFNDIENCLKLYVELAEKIVQS